MCKFNLLHSQDNVKYPLAGTGDIYPIKKPQGDKRSSQPPYKPRIACKQFLSANSLLALLPFPPRAFLVVFIH